MTETDFASTVRTYTQRKYDHTCKKIMSNRQVLTRLLKKVVYEYRDLSLEEIDALIEPTLIPARRPLGRGEMVRGVDTADKDEKEGPLIMI